MLCIPSACYNAASSKGDEFRAQDMFRPLANNPPSIPVSRFSCYILDKQVYDGYVKEIEPLKEQVRKHIVSSRKCGKTEKLHLIDTVERLGISYHFKEEIENQLEQILDETDDKSDLSTVALQFRLFRQHGLSLSSDIFHQFTENGKFKNSLRRDVEGLLNLYEAAHVRTHNDNVLEEGLIFSRNHLSCRTQRSHPYFEKLVERALQQPLHKGIPVVEARHFTSIYEEYILKNEKLLRLAKLDHNSSQLLYREELSTTLRWWKEFEPATSLPQVRDRMIESYFFALSSHPEPKHSKSRILYATYTAMGLLIDDLIDAYSTRDEREIFSRAIERWDVSDIDQLPACMMLCFKAFVKMFKGLESYAMQNGKPYAIHHLRETWKEFVTSSKIQGEYLTRNELPTFADYISNGLNTSGVKAAATAWYLPMESATEAVYDWLSRDPPIVLALMKIVRLTNDVTSYEFEKDRGIGTGIDCYMKSYNVSEETAKMKFWEMIDDAWKDFNEVYSSKRTTPITGDILDRLINQARIINAIYKDKDGFTYSRMCMEPVVDQVLLYQFKI